MSGHCRCWLILATSVSFEIAKAKYEDMLRPLDKEMNQGSEALLFNRDKELQEEIMLEIRRRSNEKKVGMRFGKYAKPKEGINWKLRKCTSDLAVNSRRRRRNLRK
jgi:hypothetical protein